MFLGRREDLRVATLTVSQPVLMARKRGDTITFCLWRVLTGWARGKMALLVLRPEREPHW